MSTDTEMELVVGCDGGVKCIYDEALDLRAFGKMQITRASHVEPDADGFWWADMGPTGGPVLGPFGTRGETLAAERRWLGRERPEPPSSAAAGNRRAMGRRNELRPTVG